MKNKNLIFSFLTVVTLTIGAGCLWTSCDDWTETEQVDYGVTTPDGQNPELYARYTQAVRNYKSRKHYAVCVRFDNGHSGDGEKDFLRSMPDSIDAVILENAVTLNSADLEDIPVLQTNFATKVLFSFNLSSIKENAESSGQEIKTLLAPALEQMVSAINDNGLDGASISYTGDIGLGNNATVNASIAEMRQLLLDKITPLAKNGKIFFWKVIHFLFPKRTGMYSPATYSILRPLKMPASYIF
ncbi:glycoside hydrolase family 18 [Bacteroides thetaiotaomicron]|nr:glycoside hydrolase family 18 [Bacteroides thetaiotaomicron]MCS2686529.1 glycoside hydrolase family 18 [Bacteroides thetaiotaomicron]MCS3356021.1 glycoside hydrolase family 18 [Bacteroides thetaiotaomicron]